MLIDRPVRHVVWPELVVLLVSAPLLLFPTIQPLLTAGALLLLAGWWLYFWYKNHIPLPTTPFNTVMLLWVIAVAAGTLVSADPELTISKATGLILGAAVWRCLVITMSTWKRLWVGLIALIAVGMGMVGLGVISANWAFEVALVQRLLPILPPQLIQLPDAPDLGVHRNELAGVTLFVFPLFLALAIGYRSLPRPRLAGPVAAIGTILLAIILLLTQSRSGWIGAVAGSLIVALLYAVLLPPGSRLRRPLYASLAVTTVLLIAAGIWLWPRLWATSMGNPEVATDTAIGTLETMAFRYELWHWAVMALADFPFTGTGLGTFRWVVTRLYPTGYTIDIAHAHNMFLQVGLDVGIPGLISYLALLLISGTVAWKAARSDSRFRPVAIGLLAAIAALHVYGLTDALAPGSKPALVFWIAIGLLAGMARITLGTTQKGLSQPLGKISDISSPRAVTPSQVGNIRS